MRLRVLADKLDCLTKQDFALLADATLVTLEAWRKRGTGPVYVRVGNRVLYPLLEVSKFLESRRRERRSTPAKDLL
jgi:hypothetical protein